MRAITAKADIVVELSELSWADASLMLDFLTLARRLRARGFTLVLCGAQPHVMTLLELVGLDRLQGVRLEPFAPARTAVLA